MKRCARCVNVSELKELGSPDSKRKKSDNETMSSESESIMHMQAVSKPLDIFGLNADVFRMIFSYCTTPDLYALAMSSDRFLEMILQSGISGRMFDFQELGECCHILDLFKMFGKQMSKIKIGEKDIQYKDRKLSKLEEILRLISTYCSVDTLKHLDLQYFYGTSIKKRYMYAALPFLRGIESFSLNEIDRKGVYICADYFRSSPAYNSTINELVERIIGQAEKITSIELTRVKVSGRFFYADHLRNLKSLSIVSSNLKAPEAFISFLESAPKLTSFKWDSSSLFGKDTMSTHSSNIVYELVANNVPDLEVFHYDQNEFYMNDQNGFVHVNLFTYPNHELIRKFQKLRVLGLTTMSIECLQMLAEINKVEELVANLPLVPGINFDFLRTFTNLKSVKFHTHYMGKQTHMDYLSNLPQLTGCHITVSTRFSAFNDVVVKAVASAKDLSVLRVSPSLIKVDLYSRLMDARLAHGGGGPGKPLTLYLEEDVFKRFTARLGPAYRPDIIEIREAK